MSKTIIFNSSISSFQLFNLKGLPLLTKKKCIEKTCRVITVVVIIIINNYDHLFWICFIFGDRHLKLAVYITVLAVFLFLL
jgi:hypothetical protein